MIKHLMVAAALFATPVLAEEGKFADGSEAKSWGLTGEENARFTAKVVDLLCEVAGQCADDCGGGTRQMGLLREADGALIYPNKNLQSVFTGAATDLHPYCGKMVEVDGLLVGGSEVIEGTPKVYQVQRIREVGGEWAKANQWTKDWAAKNPDAKGKGPWFRRDPRVNAEIEKDGYLGLSPDEDIAFIKDWY